jgi:hypothetical protein
VQAGSVTCNRGCRLQPPWRRAPSPGVTGNRERVAHNGGRAHADAVEPSTPAGESLTHWQRVSDNRARVSASPWEFRQRDWRHRQTKRRDRRQGTDTRTRKIVACNEIYATRSRSRVTDTQNVHCRAFRGSTLVAAIAGRSVATMATARAPLPPPRTPRDRERSNCRAWRSEPSTATHSTAPPARRRPASRSTDAGGSRSGDQADRRPARRPADGSGRRGRVRRCHRPVVNRSTVNELSQS